MRVLAMLAVVLVGLITLAPACHEGSPAHASPTVSFLQSPAGTVIAGATAVVFTASASSDSGDALTVTWNLGDGATASGASVVHVYPREGVFAVSVTASDSRGGVTTTGASITVGSLNGRWLLSEGGMRFYERGFDIVQSGTA